MCTLPGGSGTHDDGHSRVYRSCTAVMIAEGPIARPTTGAPVAAHSHSCNFLLRYPSRLYPIRVSFNGTVPPLDSTFLLIITFVTLLSKSGYDWTLLSFFFLSVLSCRPAHTARPVSILTPVPAPLWLRAHPDRLPLPARYLPSRLAYLPILCLVLLPPP